MKLLKLRQKAHAFGLIIEEVQNEGFVITDGGVKRPLEVKCPTLEAVAAWLKDNTSGHPNRLSEEECLEWNKQWAEFIQKEITEDKE